MNKAVVPQIPPEETKQSHTNLYSGSLDSFWSISTNLYPVWSPLRRHQPQKHPHMKGDIHAYNFTLRTVHLRDHAPCKTGSSLFSFQKEYPQGIYSYCWEGKARGVMGHSAMFFLGGLRGSVTVRYTSRRRRRRIARAKQENAKVGAFSLSSY